MQAVFIYCSPGLLKLLSQCYSKGLGNVGNQGSNKEIQPQWSMDISALIVVITNISTLIYFNWLFWVEKYLLNSSNLFWPIKSDICWIITILAVLVTRLHHLYSHNHDVSLSDLCSSYKNTDRRLNLTVYTITIRMNRMLLLLSLYYHIVFNINKHLLPFTKQHRVLLFLSSQPMLKLLLIMGART